MNDIQKQKQKLLDELYAPYIKCTMCPLGTLGRTNVVFGEGNPNASLMFIGEGPGKDEDEQGRPFVGRSGKLLTKTLEGLGIKRSDVFITNIVKCRPPNNRAPLAKESSTCKKLLLVNQIKIINPRVICTLGAAPLEALLGKKVKITELRGTILHAENTTIIPTLHPAYIMRNRKKLVTLQQDIKAAHEKSLREK